MAAASLYALRVAVGLALVSLACEPAPARRSLVSCAPAITQILVEIGASPGLVAADSASKRRTELAAALDLGERCERAPATVPGLRPDRVLVPGSDEGRALAAALEQRGLAVQLLEPRSLDQLLEVYAQLGALVGDAAGAERAVARLVREISSIAVQRDGRPRLQVVWLLSRDPLIAVGGTGVLHEILELAGADNGVHGPEKERVELSAQQLGSLGADLALDSSGVARPAQLELEVRVIPQDLARLPALDPLARIRALHALLYPPGVQGD
jgi:ABC-type hemin transport system substrate-binding protein